jgi:hypothetical protein
LRRRSSQKYSPRGKHPVCLLLQFEQYLFTKLKAVREGFCHELPSSWQKCPCASRRRSSTRYEPLQEMYLYRAPRRRSTRAAPAQGPGVVVGPVRGRGLPVAPCRLPRRRHDQAGEARPQGVLVVPGE